MASDIIENTELCNIEPHESQLVCPYDEFVRLFSEYRGMVTGTLRRFHIESNVCDDLVQEIFLSAYRKYGQLRDTEAVAGWLKTMACRFAIQWLTRTKSMSELPDDKLCESTKTERPEECIIRAETMARLHATMQELGVMDEEVLRLFYLEDLKIKDMAVLLDAPVGTIKRRLHIARKRLRALCEKCDIHPD